MTDRAILLQLLRIVVTFTAAAILVVTGIVYGQM